MSPHDFDELIVDLVNAPGLPPNWGSIFKKRVVDAAKEIDEDVIKNALELLFNEIGEDMLRKVLKDETRGKKDFRKLNGLNLDNLAKDKLSALPSVERNRCKPIYEHADHLVTEDRDGKKLEQFCRAIGFGLIGSSRQNLLVCLTSEESRRCADRGSMFRADPHFLVDVGRRGKLQ